MDVSHKKIYRNFSIYIDKLLHFKIRLADFCGLQSWFEGEKQDRLYLIEIYIKDQEPILLEYTSELLWRKILERFDKYL